MIKPIKLKVQTWLTRQDLQKGEYQNSLSLFLQNKVKLLLLRLSQLYRPRLIDYC